MLMGFLHQIRVAMFLFWPIWIPITAAAAVVIACAVSWTGSPIAQKRSVSFIGTGRKRSRGAVTAVTSLSLFLAGYIAMILAWESFTYHDNSVFTIFTLRGYDFRPPIY